MSTARTLEFWVLEGTPKPLPDLWLGGVERPEYYVVHDSAAKRTWTCTCPHFVYRGQSCKHIARCQSRALLAHHRHQ